MAKKIRKLGQLETHAVSLVNRGANKKRFAIIKSENDVNITKLLVDVIEKGDMPGDPDAYDKVCKEAGLEGQAAETFKAICKLAATFGDHEPMKKALKDALPKMLGIDQTVSTNKSDDSADDGDDDMTDEEIKKEQEAKAKAEAERVAKQEADVKEAVAKQVKDQMEGILKAQQDVIKGLQEQVAKAESDRKEAQWLVKCEADLKFVPNQTPAKLAKMLKELADKEPALADAQFEMFKALGQQMQSITKSRGFAGNAQGDQGTQGNDSFQVIMKAAQPQADSAALVTVVKSYAGLKHEHRSEFITKAAEYEAVTNALKANPELYTAYLEENPAQTTQGPPRRSN